MKLKKIAAIISCTTLGLAISSCSTDKNNAETANPQQISTKASIDQAQDQDKAQTQTTDNSKNTETVTNDKAISAQTDNTTEKQSLENTKLQMKGNASYVVGYQIGSGISNQDFGLNSEQATDGFEDAIQGSNPKISENDIRRNMESLKDKMVKKQLEMADNNKANSKDFIAEIAKLDNVEKVTDGVYYQMVKKGDGKKPKADSQVTISYKGTTPVPAYEQNKAKLNDIKQGKLIGNSFDSSNEVTFPLTNLIQCWKDAIPRIPNGSTVILYCSPDKAYGTRAPQAIGPNQALTFEITLKDFE